MSWAMQTLRKTRSMRSSWWVVLLVCQKFMIWSRACFLVKIWIRHSMLMKLWLMERLFKLESSQEMPMLKCKIFCSLTSLHFLLEFKQEFMVVQRGLWVYSFQETLRFLSRKQSHTKQLMTTKTALKLKFFKESFLMPLTITSLTALELTTSHSLLLVKSKLTSLSESMSMDYCMSLLKTSTLVTAKNWLSPVIS